MNLSMRPFEVTENTVVPTGATAVKLDNFNRTDKGVNYTQSTRFNEGDTLEPGMYTAWKA